MAKNRSIFEDVGSAQKRAAQTGMIDQRSGGARGAILIWLMILFTLVVAMILVGGLTRLTDSGLSITEWRPLTGAIPPLNAADWDAEFAKYKAIDEFQIQNKWMELSDFKVHLLVGMGASPVGPRGWACLGYWFFLVSAASENSGGLDAEIAWPWRAWWAAGCDWLVDGVQRCHSGRGHG